MDTKEDQVEATNNPLNQMVEMIKTLQQQMNRQSVQHQEEMNTRRKENQDLHTRIEQMQTQPPADLQSATKPPTDEQPSPNTGQRPRTRYPDVEMFDGNDTKDFLPFKMNLRTKFAMDGPCFLNEEERVFYAYGRLRGRASQRILPWITAKTDARETLCWEDFEKVLDKAFGDPDLKQKALVRVNTMKQGRRNLEEFLNDFDEALIHAGGLNWPDDQKKICLETSISVNLLDRLVGVSKADTYEDYCDQLRRISHDMDRLNNVKGRQTRMTQPYVPPPRHEPATGEPMDWEPTNTTRLAAMRGGANAPHTGQNNRQAQRHAQWVNNDEMERRRTEGRCIRCGGHNHFVRNCNLRRAIRPTPVAPVGTTARTEEDTGTESGNE